MDLPLWADIVLVFIAVWIVVVVVLVIGGRVLLARELALLLPNLIRLFGGLLRDARVPLRAKIVLAVASVWLASPIDLIPDFIPILGPVDDLIVSVIVLRYARRRLGDIELRRRWRGTPQSYDLLGAILG